MANTNLFVEEKRQRPCSDMNFTHLEELYGGVIPAEVILELELERIFDEHPEYNDLYLHFAKKYYAVQFGTWHGTSFFPEEIACSHLEKQDIISIDGATKFFVDSVCHTLEISYEQFDRGNGIHFFKKK